jgi:hypothetical protein
MTIADIGRRERVDDFDHGIDAPSSVRYRASVKLRLGGESSLATSADPVKK